MQVWIFFTFSFSLLQLLLKEPRRKEKKAKKEWGNTSDGEDKEEKMNCDSSRSDEGENISSDDNGQNVDEVVRRPKKTKKHAANPESSESESDFEDLDVEDADKVMALLPDNPTGLLDFANAVQGILLLLVLKQHLKNLYGFSDRWDLPYSKSWNNRCHHQKNQEWEKKKKGSCWMLFILSIY